MVIFQRNFETVITQPFVVEKKSYLYLRPYQGILKRVHTSIQNPINVIFTKYSYERIDRSHVGKQNNTISMSSYPTQPSFDEEQYIYSLIDC